MLAHSCFSKLALSAMLAFVNCGIVGLPNVGKSTIFSAITSAAAEAANYPFCTIQPNIGIVEVPDERLNRIDSMVEADKKIPAATEFVDIAGLVQGASRGEGLGNQFLSHIRAVGVIAHVVRCFENPDIVHVAGKVNPISDIETINTELALADLQTVEKRLEKNTRQLKSADTKARAEAQTLQALLERTLAHLGQVLPARTMDLNEGEMILLGELFLISAKRQIYVCNIDDDVRSSAAAEHVEAVKELADREGAETVVLSGRLEAEIASLEDPEERAAFLEEAGLAESGLSRLIKSAYKSLDLRTFFTVGGKENRAWTFRDGLNAAQCAGIIHSDFERGFIKADVYNCDELFALGSEAAVKAAGKLRMEGREYLIRDGDIVHFKFNV